MKNCCLLFLGAILMFLTSCSSINKTEMPQPAPPPVISEESGEINEDEKIWSQMEEYLAYLNIGDYFSSTTTISYLKNKVLNNEDAEFLKTINIQLDTHIDSKSTNSDNPQFTALYVKYIDGEFYVVVDLTHNDAASSTYIREKFESLEKTIDGKYILRKEQEPKTYIIIDEVFEKNLLGDFKTSDMEVNINIQWKLNDYKETSKFYVILPNQWNGAMFDRMSRQQYFGKYITDINQYPTIPEGAEVIVIFNDNCPQDVKLTRDPDIYIPNEVRCFEKAPEKEALDLKERYVSFNIDYSNGDLVYNVLDCKWDNGNSIEITIPSTNIKNNGEIL